jgi:hemerythrin-like domain-containing protein
MYYFNWIHQGDIREQAGGEQDVDDHWESSMADAIDILIEEHRLIQRVLDSLESFAESVDEERASDRSTLGEFAEFFRQYVDVCHHGKEEGYLFVRMNTYGFSNEAGPISAMLSEQGEGREHLSALAEIAQDSGPLTARECALVKGHALGYIMRIQHHMKREDDILFPVARHSLPVFVLQELRDAFEDFDRNVLTLAVRDKLVRSAQELSTRYPPGQSRPVPPSSEAAG